MENNEQTIEEQNPQDQQDNQNQEEQQEVVESQEVKDRTTEQFQKLTKSNQELKKERDQYKNLLDSLTPEAQPKNQEPTPPAPKVIEKPEAKDFGNLTQAQIDDVFDGMKDDEGYIDGNKLLDTLRDLNSRATSAEQRARRVEEHLERERVAREQQQKTNTMREVHEKFPQLDPESEEFNPQYYQLVRNELISQMLEGEEDVLKAAEKMAQYIPMNKEDKKAQEEAQIKQEQKAQINATRPKSSMMKGYYENEEDDALRQKVLKGKKGAIAEMLRRRGQ